MRIKKTGAATQVHSADGDGWSVKATISEHGYAVKVTADLNYNMLAGRRIGFAHKAIREVINSAIITSDKLRESNPAMFDTAALFDIQPEHAAVDDGNHA